MWTNIERGIDGAVGRMLSWLTHPPVRSVARAREETSDSASAEAAGRTDAVREEAVREEAVHAAPGPAAVGLAEAGQDTVAADPVSAVAEAVEGAAADGDELAEEILEALAAAPDGLALNQLSQQVSGEPRALRHELRQLSASGRIQRRSQGMRTRYYLAQA